MLTASFIQKFSAEGSAPEWIQLLPAGEFMAVDGRGPYLLDRPEAVIEQFVKDGGKIPIDENHAIDIQTSQGGSTPARGWIVELQSRETGIWGRVEWTAAGKILVEDKAYGFISPVFMSGKSKPQRITQILRAALTNDPGLPQLENLLTREENEMDEEIRTALGLSKEASDEDVLKAAQTAYQASTSHPALLTRVAEAAGVDKSLTGDALITAIESRGSDTSEVSELRADLKTVRSEFTALVTSTAKERAVTVIDGAIKDCKIVPALRDHYIARHTKNPDEVETEIAASPSINAGGLGGHKDPTKEGELSGSDQETCQLLGVDPEKYAATLKAEQKEAL